MGWGGYGGREREEGGGREGGRGEGRQVRRKGGRGGSWGTHFTHSRSHMVIEKGGRGGRVHVTIHEAKSRLDLQRRSSMYTGSRKERGDSPPNTLGLLHTPAPMSHSLVQNEAKRLGDRVEDEDDYLHQRDNPRPDAQSVARAHRLRSVVGETTTKKPHSNDQEDANDSFIQK